MAAREDRFLVRMAAKSGNVGVFKKAMDTVLLRGKVKTTSTPENDLGVSAQLFKSIKIILKCDIVSYRSC